MDNRPTLAGHIVEAAELFHGIGTGWDVPRFYPTRAVVILVHGGGVYRDTQGFDAELIPGDLILVHPGIGHTYGPRVGEEWDEWYVSFGGPIFDALEDCGVLDICRPVWRLRDVRSWLSRLKVIFPSSGRVIEASEQVGTLAAWLLSASAHVDALARPEAAGADVWLTRAKQLLGSPGIESGNLEWVARECGLGYESFRKRFTTLTGETPAKYRRELLISRAQALMAERDLPDRAIAASLGFCDEFHFSKTFKKIAGLSPRQWRSNQERR